MKINSDEALICGSWLLVDNRVTGDEAAKRIEWLIKHHLQEIGRDASGWNALYRDPFDGRLWELSYPSSEDHGGGPPQLRNVRVEEVNALFPNLGRLV